MLVLPLNLVAGTHLSVEPRTLAFDEVVPDRRANVDAELQVGNVIMKTVQPQIAIEPLVKQMLVVSKGMGVLSVDDLVALGAEVVHAVLSFHAGTPFVGLPEFLDQ